MDQLAHATNTCDVEIQQQRASHTHFANELGYAFAHILVAVVKLSGHALCFLQERHLVGSRDGGLGWERMGTLADGFVDQIGSGRVCGGRIRSGRSLAEGKGLVK